MSMIKEGRETEVGGVDLQEVYDYLDDLRESGEINMFAAPGYLQSEYDMSKADSFTAFKAWTEDFGK